jgi:hypothetical protein
VQLVSKEQQARTELTAPRAQLVPKVLLVLTAPKVPTDKTVPKASKV